MREHYRIDRTQCRRQWLPVAQAQLLVTLEKPAVDQHPCRVMRQQELAARHRTRPAEKSQLHGIGSQVSITQG
ncbi:hypothetical protein D3C75_1262080 [compost metagenome]